jgi:type I restriction enzyme R subunit
MARLKSSPWAGKVPIGSRRLLGAGISRQLLIFVVEKPKKQTSCNPAPPASVDYSHEDEATTRERIDAQLRQAGWEANSKELTFAAGARPQCGLNRAIAEWPTTSGPADYVLFVGLTPLGIAEAKRHIKDVAGRLPQARRYSRGFSAQGSEAFLGGPWDSHKIPFIFATNGRPYLRQLQEKSGIWFQDLRHRTNHPRPLNGWYSPDGLMNLFKADHVSATEALLDTPVDIGALHPYQVQAIEKVEEAIAAGSRAALVAMATGTGKTRVAIALLFRLIKYGRFRRALFLVDRETLGDQAGNRFKELRLENLQTFAEIYDIKELDDIRPDPNTRLHLATVQGMVKRLLYPSPGQPPIPVDQYDLIIVDECHRGYILDRELADQELLFKDEQDYISKYRRVLDHFDAVKIGLTATPAQHTTEIFGKPIFTYSYRQAVIDGFLVDHEPPVRLVTRLAKRGIKWEKGQPLKLYRSATGTVDLTTAPDEIKFEVDKFNDKVITEPFNRVICEELAREIDPGLPGKTLIFCVRDSHADLVVRLLRESLEKRYGPIHDDTVTKITGNTDKPRQLVLKYQNEQLPKIAVTVDLLTTGIDVPEIVNLVFIRRVRSRLLYEQMLGRATRLCPDLFGPGQDKEIFRIFDAVDLYAALEDFNTMKPVVKDVHVTFAKLLAQLTAAPDEASRRTVKDEIIALFQRKRRKLQSSDDQLKTLCGRTTQGLIALVRDAAPADIVALLNKVPGLVVVLDDLTTASAPPSIPISEHPDALEIKERGYGKSTRPEDYLDGFGRWLKQNMNLLPALVVIAQRPCDLTRAQLKEIKLALDEAGYSEINLRTAWREWKNQDIAATIIGFIRNRATGSPLLPYAQRVELALQGILFSRSWTAPQRQWLQRIANQIKAETVVDRVAFDQGVFAANGGFTRLNKTFDGQLEAVVTEFHDRIWQVAA